MKNLIMPGLAMVLLASLVAFVLHLQDKEDRDSAIQFEICTADPYMNGGIWAHQCTSYAALSDRRAGELIVKQMRFGGRWTVQIVKEPK